MTPWQRVYRDQRHPPCREPLTLGDWLKPFALLLRGLKGEHRD